MATSVARIETWTKVRLKDLCHDITVGHVGPMASEYTESGIPFLRSQNVLPFRLDLSDVKFISEGFHRRLKKSTLFPNDVVVVRTGYPGTACVIPSNLPVSNCADLVVIRPTEQLNPHFLAALFNSTWGQGQVTGSLVGVAQQHFNIGAAREMIINLPPLPTQRKIAAILSAYDDLIANNTRRIALLEDLARALYREWFVRFRYPGHASAQLVDSPLGPIPEGWEVAPISSVYAALYDGPHATPPPSDDGPVFLGIKNMTELGRLDLRDIRHISEDDFSDWTRRVTPSPTDIVFTYEAALHRYAMIPKGLRCCLGRRVALIRPNPARAYPSYLFRYLLSDQWHRTVSQHVILGATVDRIPLVEFPSFPMLLPPVSLQAHADVVLSSIGEQVDDYISTLANLRQTRDLLLPKLVSGAVDVAAAEIAMEL